MDNDKHTGLCAAIIGCGGISRVHAQSLDALGIPLVAACDIVPERAAAYADTYGAKAYADWKAMIDDGVADVYHICTPHGLHADMALRALDAGAYVLCEKPMATTLDDAREMARRGGDRLGIVFQNRYNEASRRMIETVRSGRLGRLLGLRGIVTWHRDAPYYVNSGWRGAWSSEGGGVLINQAIHTLDLLLLLGGDVASIRGKVSTDSLYDTIEVEDSAHFRIAFQNGVVGVFYATNGYVKDMPVSIDASFENGELRMVGDTVTERLSDIAGEAPSGAPAPLGKGYWGTGHLPLIADYYACIREGRRFPIDGVAGMKALKALLSVYESSNRDETVIWTDQM